MVVLKIMATCDVEADLGGYGSLKKLSFALSVYVNVYVRLCTCFLRYDVDDPCMYLYAPV